MGAEVWAKTAVGRQLIAEKLVLWHVPLAYAALFIWGSVLQMRSFVISDVEFSYFLPQICGSGTAGTGAPFLACMKVILFTFTTARRLIWLWWLIVFAGKKLQATQPDLVRDLSR